LADLQRTVYSRKWSPVSCRWSAGQGNFAGQRPTFYRCVMQPTRSGNKVDDHSMGGPRIKYHCGQLHIYHDSNVHRSHAGPMLTQLFCQVSAQRLNNAIGDGRCREYQLTGQLVVQVDWLGPVVVRHLMLTMAMPG